MHQDIHDNFNHIIALSIIRSHQRVCYHMKYGALKKLRRIREIYGNFECDNLTTSVNKLIVLLQTTLKRA